MASLLDPSNIGAQAVASTPCWVQVYSSIYLSPSPAKPVTTVHHALHNHMHAHSRLFCAHIKTVYSSTKIKTQRLQFANRKQQHYTMKHSVKIEMFQAKRNVTKNRQTTNRLFEGLYQSPLFRNHFVLDKCTCYRSMPDRCVAHKPITYKQFKHMQCFSISINIQSMKVQTFIYYSQPQTFCHNTLTLQTTDYRLRQTTHYDNSQTLQYNCLQKQYLQMRCICCTDDVVRVIVDDFSSESQPFNSCWWFREWKAADIA